MTKPLKVHSGAFSLYTIVLDSRIRCAMLSRKGGYMAKRKLAKPTLKKGHKIAKKVAKKRGHKKPTSSDYAIGISTAKKSAAKRKRKKK